jgi:hypothetical protein
MTRKQRGSSTRSSTLSGLRLVWRSSLRGPLFSPRDRVAAGGAARPKAPRSQGLPVRPGRALTAGCRPTPDNRSAAMPPERSWQLTPKGESLATTRWSPARSNTRVPHRLFAPGSHRISRFRSASSLGSPSTRAGRGAVPAATYSVTRFGARSPPPTRSGSERCWLTQLTMPLQGSIADTASSRRRSMGLRSWFRLLRSERSSASSTVPVLLAPYVIGLPLPWQIRGSHHRAFRDCRGNGKLLVEALEQDAPAWRWDDGDGRIQPQGGSAFRDRHSSNRRLTSA